MNKEQLKEKLIQMNVYKDIYCLEGGLPNECLTLGKKGDTWEVYYSERGIKTGLKTFHNEQEACEHIYHQIIDTNDYLKKSHAHFFPLHRKERQQAVVPVYRKIKNLLSFFQRL
jgi:hypothetical protein